MRGASLLAVGIVLTTGCAGRMAAPSGATDGTVLSLTAASPGDVMSERDRRRLEGVVGERAHDPGDGGYRIGPDDLLDIRIPDLLETQAGTTQVAAVQAAGVAGGPTVAQVPTFQQGFRVGARGDVTLPLVGTIKAGGLSAAELEAELGRRLVATGLLRRPQVTVLVAEYRSRVVAVVGSVERPGLYPLTRPDATLADLLWAAGGPKQDAGRVVDFVPSSGAHDVPRAPDLVRLQRGEPIRIDLEGLLHASGAEASTLDPPVRPGDLISVPPGGTVHVDGWVEKPGSYPVTRALTLSGAVAAAGGHLFPCDCKHVRVKRVLGTGEQRSFTVDLDGVRDGRTPDFPLTDGDAVRVPASIPRMVPYGAWTIVTALVHVGATVPLF